MLSDEEKKAINEVKHFKELTRYWQEEEYEEKEIAGYIGIVLNLIEKQSKEVEKLKEKNKDLDEKNFKHTIKIASLQTDVQEITKLINKNWEDKIKAKIEEYKKEIDKLYKKKNWYEPWDTEKKNKYMNYIEFGQSLLEKE